MSYYAKFLTQWHAQPEEQRRLRNAKKVRRVFADRLYWLAIFIPGDAWADAAHAADYLDALLVTTEEVLWCYSAFCLSARSPNQHVLLDHGILVLGIRPLTEVTTWVEEGAAIKVELTKTRGLVEGTRVTSINANKSIVLTDDRAGAPSNWSLPARLASWAFCQRGQEFLGY